MAIMELLTSLLELFAEAYSPKADSEKMTSSMKAVLARQRQYVQDCISEKETICNPKAEAVANSHDQSLRWERRVAEKSKNGKKWERILIGKRSALVFVLNRILAGLDRLDAMIADPASEVVPVLGYFTMKMQANRTLLEQYLRAFTKVTGVSTLPAFKRIAEDIGKTIGEYEALVDGETDLSRVEAWLKMQEAEVKDQPEPETEEEPVEEETEAVA